MTTVKNTSTRLVSDEVTCSTTKTTTKTLTVSVTSVCTRIFHTVAITVPETDTVTKTTTGVAVTTSVDVTMTETVATTTAVSTITGSNRHGYSDENCHFFGDKCISAKTRTVTKTKPATTASTHTVVKTISSRLPLRSKTSVIATKITRIHPVASVTSTAFTTRQNYSPVYHCPGCDCYKYANKSVVSLTVIPACAVTTNHQSVFLPGIAVFFGDGLTKARNATWKSSEPHKYLGDTPLAGPAPRLGTSVSTRFSPPISRQLLGEQDHVLFKSPIHLKEAFDAQIVSPAGFYGLYFLGT
ncbi:hypothetical protein C8J56DRAFT_902678 [Mycena floridula]|nr:hypothetical protein C8J56DRAFT_902678 [Mycena floridula]